MWGPGAGATFLSSVLRSEIAPLAWAATRVSLIIGKAANAQISVPKGLVALGLSRCVCLFR